MLEIEEQRALKKIEETKQKTKTLLQLRDKNNKKYLEKLKEQEKERQLHAVTDEKKERRMKARNDLQQKQLECYMQKKQEIDDLRSFK